MAEDPQFGIGDATFQAAGGEAGIRALVDTFYDIMSSDLQYRTIRSWHPDDNHVSRDKLARFLCGWMGGPRRYNEKYGSISIPHVHAHLDVTERERDDWLGCMAKALAKQAVSAGPHCLSVGAVGRTGGSCTGSLYTELTAEA